MAEIKVIDTTLRDAHQCLWATRMTTAMMLPVAEQMDRAGFEAIDLMSAIQFDVCVRYLKEDPWQRLRLMRQKVTRTRMQSAMRSKRLLSFDVQPDDVNYLWVRFPARDRAPRAGRPCWRARAGCRSSCTATACRDWHRWFTSRASSSGSHRSRRRLRRSP